MAKAKAAAVSEEEKKELKIGGSADVKGIVEKIGKEAIEGIEGTTEEKKAAKVAMVRDRAKQEGLTFPDTLKSLHQYIDKARRDLGWAQKRTRTSKGTEDDNDDEPTGSELKAAKAILAKYGADKIAEILAAVEEAGGKEKLEQCRLWWEEVE